MIVGPWVSVWKRRMRAYAIKNNIPIPTGFRPRTPYWGHYAEVLAIRVKTHGGVKNPTGKLDGQLRKVLYHTVVEPSDLPPPFAGIDVSNHNGTIAWGAVPKDIKFVWAKATEGYTFVDRYFDENYDGAKRNGFTVGAYHFMRADSPTGVRGQMDHFFRHNRYTDGDLLPVLDWENTTGSVVDVPSQAATLEAAVKYVEQKIGRLPVIYSGAYVLHANQFSRNSVVKKCPLWIAAYPHVPFVPAPWKAYDVHQYSSSGSVKGINGRVDMNTSFVPLSVLT